MINIRCYAEVEIPFSYLSLQYSYSLYQVTINICHCLDIDINLKKLKQNGFNTNFLVVVFSLDKIELSTVEEKETDTVKVV